MPTVYISRREREEAKERRELETLLTLMDTAPRRLNQENQELARAAQINPTRWSQIKHGNLGRGVGCIPISTVRSIAHAVGCTPEEWLRIGGFTKGGQTNDND